MPSKTERLTVTERQQQRLQEIIVARSSPQGLVQRATMILRAFAGSWNHEIAAELDVERHAVGYWRRRWQAAWDTLLHAECLGQPGELRRTIEQTLSDQPRAGCKGKFAPEQVARIIALACEDPKESGRPISHWSTRELAEEAVKRGIVPAISARHIGRFLKDGRLTTAS